METQQKKTQEELFDLQAFWKKSSARGPERVVVSQPELIGTYVKEASSGSILECPSPFTKLKKFSPPTLPIDLNQGYEESQNEKERENFTSILPLITTLEGILRKVKGQNTKRSFAEISDPPPPPSPSLAQTSFDPSTYSQLGVEFVSFRNNLNKILETPYSRNEWKMEIYRHTSGTIFLDIRMLPEKVEKSEYYKRSLYWGVNFETLCCSLPQQQTQQDKQRQPNKESTQLNSTEGKEETTKLEEKLEFCAVVRVKLGSHRIVLGAEIDAYIPSSTSNQRESIELANMVELKTSEKLDNPRTNRNFHKYKLLRIWIQSFLAGVPTIMIGFRDQSGWVEEIQKFRTLDLPRIAGRDNWDPNICLAFASQVLDWLKKVVEKGKRYTLSFNPQSSSSPGLSLVPSSETDQFLPPHYFS